MLAVAGHGTNIQEKLSANCPCQGLKMASKITIITIMIHHSLHQKDQQVDPFETHQRKVQDLGALRGNSATQLPHILVALVPIFTQWDGGDPKQENQLNLKMKQVPKRKSVVPFSSSSNRKLLRFRRQRFRACSFPSNRRCGRFSSRAQGGTRSIRSTDAWIIMDPSGC